MIRLYKGFEITLNLSGWYSTFSSSIGYLKADTFDGIKSLIDSKLKSK